MNKIELDFICPAVFTTEEVVGSNIWNQKREFIQGEKYLIQAASGKGKSSFCNFVYGKRKDYSGSIYLDSKNSKDLKTKDWDIIHQKNISSIFQDLQLFSELSAIENVILKNNLTNYKTIEQIDDMFNQLDIANKKNQIISKLSYGQQQRVAIIRSLCQPFQFLLMDEPISHLDDENAIRIAALISVESQAQQAGVIVMSIGKDLPLVYDKILQL